MVCKCKPSLFAYPSAVTQEAASTAAKVPTAVLSTTARAREKAKKKEAEKSVKAEGGDKPASDEAGLPSLPWHLPLQRRLSGVLGRCMAWCNVPMEPQAAIADTVYCSLICQWVPLLCGSSSRTATCLTTQTITASLCSLFQSCF